jgi:YfiH family protein
MTEVDRVASWHEHLTIELPGAQVVFTTRRGGVSTGPFESLNLGRLTDDRAEAVVSNRRRLQERVGRRLAMVRQVHGATVHLADEAWPEATGEELAELPEGDGTVTTSSDLAPMVLVADCLPVALAGEGSVAMVHAGWRGLATGVLEEAVRMLRERAPDAEISAAVGPGIGVCCYEVGEEVHRAFSTYGERVRRGQNLDLRAVAQIQLEQAGVRGRHDLDVCTSCSPELFFSHRRDRGMTGRQAGLIWLS